MNSFERYGCVLRIWDNGGKTADRYTMLPPRWARSNYVRVLRYWEGIAASEHPFHPQGFGQNVTARAGPHLGKRIAWADLPPDVQRFAREVFPDYCPKESPTK